MTDIVILRPNMNGKDHYIGDIHGEARPLKALLQALKANPEDRLITVGDHADRGPQSLEVYLAIINHNEERIKQGLPPQIFAIRGNHEEAFLKFYKNRHDPSSHEYQFFMQPGIGGEWAEKATEEQLLKIRNFILSCPYMYCVQSKDESLLDSATVAHAARPFSEKVFRQRIAENKLDLNDTEKLRATESRKTGRVKFVPEDENYYDAPTICGHNAGEGLRKESNHINLDVLTYLSNNMAVLDYYNCTINIVGDDKKKNTPLVKFLSESQQNALIGTDVLSKSVQDIAIETEKHLKLVRFMKFGNQFLMQCSWIQAQAKQQAQSQAVPQGLNQEKERELYNKMAQEGVFEHVKNTCHKIISMRQFTDQTKKDYMACITSRLVLLNCAETQDLKTAKANYVSTLSHIIQPLIVNSTRFSSDEKKLLNQICEELKSSDLYKYTTSNALRPPQEVSLGKVASSSNTSNTSKMVISVRSISKSGLPSSSSFHQQAKQAGGGGGELMLAKIIIDRVMYEIANTIINQLIGDLNRYDGSKRAELKGKMLRNLRGIASHILTDVPQGKIKTSSDVTVWLDKILAVLSPAPEDMPGHTRDGQMSNILTSCREVLSDYRRDCMDKLGKHPSLTKGSDDISSSQQLKAK